MHRTLSCYGTVPDLECSSAGRSTCSAPLHCHSQRPQVKGFCGVLWSRCSLSCCWAWTHGVMEMQTRGVGVAHRTMQVAVYVPHLASIWGSPLMSQLDRWPRSSWGEPGFLCDHSCFPLDLALYRGTLSRAPAPLELSCWMREMANQQASSA